jgi:hypothetical protein
MTDRSYQHHDAPVTGDHPVPPSDRSFGVVFAVVFTLIGCYPLIHGGRPFYWLFAVAAAFGLAAWLVPSRLAPLNRLWFRFGQRVSRVVNPVILALLFFVVVAPTGLIRRIFNRDPLGLRWDPNAQSYWVERTPPGPPPDGMRNQY